MRRYRNFVIAATILLCAGVSGFASALVDGETVADGWLYDWALRARAVLQPEPADYRSPVVVIGIDHRSLFSPRLSKLPRPMMAPEWKNLIDALVEADARAIGFDILFLYRANAFIPNYDTKFLQALRRNKDKVVIGRSGTLLPERYFRVAIGARNNPKAVAAFDIEPDFDQVLRRIRREVSDREGNAVIGLAAAMVETAGGGPMPDEVRLAPRRHLEALEHYSLIDVLQCAEQRPDLLREVFAGRVVLVGSALPAEDRKVTAGRYLPEPPYDSSAANATETCDLTRRGDTSEHDTTSAGVFSHAEAIRAVLDDDLVRQVPLQWSVMSAAVAGATGAVIGLLLLPVTIGMLLVPAAALPLLLLGAGFWGAEVYALMHNNWYPASPAIAALILSAVVAYLVRYLLEERRRRQIQRAFGHYLAPTVVEQLMEGGEALRLGGETQDISVMFADLSGFTNYSTQVAPEQLVELTNRYLSMITDEVDRHGGYVDKYIGDASMALWGAPVRLGDHALQAVYTALAIRDRVEAMRLEAEAQGEFGFGIKVGVASGPAVVGNVGSERRFNYTAVGETVNIAARLEGLPGIYQCAVVVAESTAGLAADKVLMRELDWVTVKGRDEPLAIYEALGPVEDVGEEERLLKSVYEEGLAAYRARRFDVAAEIWSPRAAGDGPSRVMAERARTYAMDPPPAGWDGVWAITTK